MGDANVIGRRYHWYQSLSAIPWASRLELLLAAGCGSVPRQHQHGNMRRDIRQCRGCLELIRRIYGLIITAGLHVNGLWCLWLNIRSRDIFDERERPLHVVGDDLVFFSHALLQIFMCLLSFVQHGCSPHTPSLREDTLRQVEEMKLFPACPVLLLASERHRQFVNALA